MKKIKEYSFNGGLDGVVNAKSLKHACKLISKFYDSYTSCEIMESCLKENKENCDWSVDIYVKVKKKEKSRVIGWLNF